MDTTDQLYTIKAVAAVLGVNERTVRSLISRGELGHVELSPRQRRCTSAQIEAFLRAKSRAGIPAQKRGKR